MKKITLLAIIFMSTLGFSQNQLLGFETTETGGVDGTPFGNGPAPVVETGLGSNATKVLKIVGNPSGEPWQGINLNLTSPTNLTNLQTMTIDVYSDVAITFLVKATGGVGGPATVAAAATHTGGSTWQTISFTFNTVLDGQGALASGIYNKFVIHTYWVAGETTFFPGGNPIPRPVRTFYVDNIKGPLGSTPVVPSLSIAAPTPPARPVADVISLFSEAYANIPVTEWSASFDDSNISDVSIVGNATKKIDFTNFLGVILTNYVNATSMTHFHMDYWIPSGTNLVGKTLNPKLSNHAAQSGETGALLLTNLPTVAGSWASLDAELSTFTPQGAGVQFARQAIKEFIIASTLSTVYVDNIYLHKNTTLATNTFEIANVRMYPNPANNVLNIDAKSNIENVSIYNLLGQEVIVETVNKQSASLDISNLQSGVYVVKTSIDGKIASSRLIKE